MPPTPWRSLNRILKTGEADGTVDALRVLEAIAATLDDK
jgi:hypothetical protein